VTYLCSFERIDGGAPDAKKPARSAKEPAAIVTVIDADEINMLVTRLVQAIAAISCIVLALAAVGIFTFSRKISRPLKTLTAAARQFEYGDYSAKLSVTRKDEIGSLQGGFIRMENGLENYEKFTNKVITAQARQGLLMRAGETRDAAVMFAFIRDFEEKWEDFDAKEVVVFVNKFLGRIVPCINETGGVVDKYLTQGGVIVMAVWGAINKNTPEDCALAAVDSALLMRRAVRNFNDMRHSEASFKVPGDRRLGTRAPLVKLGCAINCGSLVAGQIGGEERLEYTVIGDTVNLAARLEGPNDMFDTDVLVSEAVKNLVNNKFICARFPPLEVKGKNLPLNVYTILGERGGEEFSSMKELRESWQSVRQHSDVFI
jgi:adenylate cyclase